MRFPLVSVPSSALLVIAVFGIVSVVRVRCTHVVFGRVSVNAFSRFVLIVRVISFLRYRSGGVRCTFFCRDSLVRVTALRSYIVPSRMEDKTRLRALLRSFFRVSLPLRYGSFRGIFICVWTFRYRFYRSIVVLLCSFGLSYSSVPRHS